MKKAFRHIILLIAFALILINAKAQQDPIFTQYMFNNQAINPAYAGIWEKVGFHSLVRKQWAGIQRSPLTEMLSFHTPLKNEFVGLGLNVVADQFGREKRLSLFGDYAFEVSLNRTTRMRLGLKFGFMNYQNPLTDYLLYPDGKFDPAFAEDIDIRFMPNFGVGTFIYNNNYYISFSVPKLINNDFKANYNNFSSLAEVRTAFLSGGYVFDLGPGLKFKPTAMCRATLGAPFQFDLAGNFLIREKLWLGGMYRSGDALCVIAQWIFDNNLKIGYAMDFSFTEIYKYQNGTYELTLSYDIDFYGRSYIRPKYF